MRSVVLGALLVGCSGGSGTDESGDTSAPSTDPATLTLAFDLDADLIPTMSEPAAGFFHGSVYAEDQASAIGPTDISETLADFDSLALDFGTEGGLSAPSATVGPIDPQVVWILGCFDPDDNGCDCADPVTVPNENKFQLTSGENAITITMSLLNPC
jgi:hypothetical protein